MTHGARISGEVIPDHILALMTKKDRPKGVAGLLPAEIHAGQVEKAEKALQREVANYLQSKGIEIINPPMNKKSALPIGWPDFSFSYRGVPVAWECKRISGKLDPAQAKMRDKLTANPNCWQWRLIRDLSEARDHLRSIEGGQFH